MNKFYFGILLVVIIGILFPYLIILQKKIAYLNTKKNLGLSKSIDQFTDIAKIYLILKRDKSQNRYLYSILFNFLILSIIILLLWLVLIYLFFTFE